MYDLFLLAIFFPDLRIWQFDFLKKENVLSANIVLEECVV